uniref:C-type lectin domain-containing protein n=1 Tax=Castor canadensis TaxID=51338 RepID=A0A8C0W1J2_CASCN
MVSPLMALHSLSWMLLFCLMLLSQVQGEDSQKDLPSLCISCPKVSQDASHCYALFKTPKSWMDADLACQKRPSGHLVSLLSGVEASFVSSLVKSTVNSYQYIWMGSMTPHWCGWEWSNTDVLNYLNWERNPSIALNPDYCGRFLKWRDLNCDVQLPYVCKFKN